MARTTTEIQAAIHADLTASRPDLSPSKSAEWRLWTWIVSTAIRSLDILMDQFRDEMDAAADKITPGTARWYAEQCRRFQNGHELLFDSNTAQLYYAVDDPDARIVKIVAVVEGEKSLIIKAAKIDNGGNVVPLSSDELLNFTGYLDSIKFAGINITTLSTSADRVRYEMTVFYDPTVPATTVRDRVLAALDAFRSELGFNSMLYRQKLASAVMAVEGVVTVDLEQISRKGTSMDEFKPCGVAEELESGYFDYDEAGCILTLVSSKTA